MSPNPGASSPNLGASEEKQDDSEMAPRNTFRIQDRGEKRHKN